LEVAKPDATPALPRPEPLSLSEVKWAVTGEGQFCVDGRGYESLSRNAAETLRWVSEASWQLEYYRGGVK
jgi:hypothetical protein